jgi:hypothetical protein
MEASQCLFCRCTWLKAQLILCRSSRPRSPWQPVAHEYSDFRQKIRASLHVDDRTELCLIHLSANLGYVPKDDSVRDTMIQNELKREIYAAESTSSFSAYIKDIKPNPHVRT